jgi:RNA 2',3'-cyclic 3'-phosphodiesterase
VPRSDPDDSVRTFVALYPPPGGREEIGAIRARLQRRLAEELGCEGADDAPGDTGAASTCVRWVPLEQAHVTLAFLGTVRGDRLAAIRDRIAAVAAAAEPFGLGLGGVGAFPDARRARVIWLGVSAGRDSTADLARGVGRALEPLGFGPAAEPFRAHLTLGRVRRSARAAERNALARVLRDPEFLQRRAHPRQRPLDERAALPLALRVEADLHDVPSWSPPFLRPVRSGARRCPGIRHSALRFPCRDRTPASTSRGRW